ncbi:septum formation initiator family protein [Pelotomaculum propionicicum]|uniref:septum formation initiator family protein n=1 Tax=Pelotomaculum propionicicum TaxID=258475 RepID=UPI003B7A615C
MIVAQEKTGYFRLSEDAPRPKKFSWGKKSFPKNHRLVLIGLVLAGFLVGVSITVYCSQIITLGYQITSLEKELALLRIENHSLDEEIHQMTSLERVEFLAVNKLGMVRPDENNILVVTVAGKNQPAGTPGPAVDEGQDDGIALAGKEKSRLIRAFDELVNKLGNTIRPEQRMGFEPAEGKDADNTNPGSQKNNLGFDNSCGGVFRPDPAPGLASAC